MRRYWFYVKNDFSNFHKISTFWDPLSEKNGFYDGVFLPFGVVYKHDNFRKDYRTGLCFGILLEGLKRKEEFVNQPFWTNGSGFIHQKRFFHYQIFNFSTKIYEIWKKCWGTKFFISKGSTTLVLIIFS